MTVLSQSVGWEEDPLTEAFVSGVQKCFLLVSASWAI